MAQEIEAKFHIDDFAPVRAGLRRVGAERLGAVIETNRYFDWPDGRLRESDCGLRIRTVEPIDGEKADPSAPLLTYKGPRQESRIKVRREIQFRLDDADAAAEFLQAIGLAPSLTFQKRRESWMLGTCQVDLDEMPLLGLFLEIEGPDESAVNQAREQLGLSEDAIEQTPYIGLLHDYLARHKISRTEIRFSR